MADNFGYTEGAPWNGQRRWVCDDPLCQYATTNEERIQQHVFDYHVVQTELVNTGLVDAKGNPITARKPVVRDLNEEE